MAENQKGWKIYFMEQYALYFIDIILHLDKHLPEIMAAYGHFIYAILFLVVFCETGLVVTPFLPGDSLLFACGALAWILRSLLLFF